jgi:hypothetical protein
MPVANTKSTNITKLDTFQRADSGIFNGRLYSQVATVEVAATDDDTSVFRFFRVPSRAVVLSVQILNDAITGGTSYDFGVHRTAADGGAVVDADAFATAVDMATARTAPLDVRFEASNIDTVERQLWQAVTASPALTIDPRVDYDITATANTVGSAAGTITARIVYQL